MPKLSISFIRTALIYLLLGFTAGGLLLIQKGINFESRIWILLPIHIEWMIMGWVFQLVMGVAFWILPRFSNPPVRGNVITAIFAYFILNFGIVIIFMVNLFRLNETLELIGRISEAIAVILFVIHAWPRVRAFSD